MTQFILVTDRDGKIRINVASIKYYRTDKGSGRTDIAFVGGGAISVTETEAKIDAMIRDDFRESVVSRD